MVKEAWATHTCRVKVGSHGSLKRMCALPCYEGQSAIEPVGFECVRCQQRWKADDVSTPYDLDHASCSNCYSSNVYLTSVKVLARW